MKDDFVSTEHLFIAILEVQSEAREILARYRINKDIVIEIRKMHNDGYTYKQISQKFGISESQTGAIGRYKAWNNI